MKTKKENILYNSIFRLVLLLIVLFAVMAVTKGPQLMKISIFQTICRQMSELGLMAIGCSLCMISGGIDLSCVYIANLAGISAALVMQQTDGNVLPGILIGILVGVLCGAFNGFLVAWLKIPAMLATLGSYQVFLGLGIVLSEGSSVSGSEVLADFGASTVGIFPSSFIIYLILAILVMLLISRNKFGKRLYFVGSNERCSVFSGINAKLVLMKTYMLSGVLCSVAGLLSLARINSAKADFGTSYTMECILIAVLGGINPNGGAGALPGVAIAVVILQMLSAYLNTFPDISNYYRDLIWGVALIGVLIANYYFDRRKVRMIREKSSS